MSTTGARAPSAGWPRCEPRPAIPRRRPATAWWPGSATRPAVPPVWTRPRIRSRCHTSPPWPAAAWSWAPPSARRPRAPRTPSRAASPEVPSLLTRGGRGPGPPPFASRSAEDLHPSHGGRETGTCSCPSGILTPPLPGCAVRQGSPARIVPSSPRWRWWRCSRHRPRAPARCVGCGCPLLASSDPAAINGGLRLQLDAEYLRIDAGTDDRPGYTDQLTQWSYRSTPSTAPSRTWP